MAVPLCVFLFAGVLGAGAQPLDPHQACAPDAMRLCSEFIPDEPKITRCMIAKKAQLSSDCRTAMAGPRPARSHRTHHRRHDID